MLNRKVLTLITAAGLVGFGGVSSNVFAATGDGNASAVIVAPLAIQEDQAMSFGQISPDATNQTTVTVGLTNNVFNSGAVNAGLVGGTPLSGQFTISGSGNSTYVLSFTAGSLLCQTPATCFADTMAVGNFSHNSTQTLSGGLEQFEVGADLTVGAGQNAGDYQGTYQITVTYP